MAQTESRLTRVDTRAEEFKLEVCLQLSVVCWCCRFHSEAALPDAVIRLSIRSKFVRKRRQLGWTDHVEPVRMVLFELVARVEHCKAINLEGAFALAVVVLWFGGLSRRCFSRCCWFRICRFDDCWSWAFLFCFYRVDLPF